MHDVFLSYSSADKTIADMACAVLERAGVRVWIAPRDVLAGSDYPAQLTGAIEGCKVLVAVWSEHFDASEHTRREVEIAVSCGKHVLPLRIADVPMGASSRYLFAGKHWLDAITPPIEAHLVHLTRTVKTLLGQAIGPERTERTSSPARPRRHLAPILLAVVLVTIAGWFLLRDRRSPEVAQPRRSAGLPTDSSDALVVANQVLRGQDRALAERHAEMLTAWGHPERAAPPALAAAFAAAPRIAAFPTALGDERTAVERIVNEASTTVGLLLRADRERLARTSGETRALLDQLEAVFAAEAADPATLALVEQFSRRLDALNRLPVPNEAFAGQLSEAHAKLTELRRAMTGGESAEIEDLSHRLDALESTPVSIEACEHAESGLSDLRRDIEALRGAALGAKAETRRKLHALGVAELVARLKREIEDAESTASPAVEPHPVAKPGLVVSPASVAPPASDEQLRNRVVSWSGRVIPTVWLRTQGRSKAADRRDWRFETVTDSKIRVATSLDRPREPQEIALPRDCLEVPLPRYAGSLRDPPLRFVPAELPAGTTAGTLLGHVTFFASPAPDSGTWLILDVGLGIVLASSLEVRFRPPSGDLALIEGGLNGLDPFVGSDVQIPISTLTKGRELVIHGSLCVADKYPRLARRSTLTVAIDGVVGFSEAVGERRRVDFVASVPADALHVQLVAKSGSGESFVPVWNCVWFVPRD